MSSALSAKEIQKPTTNELSQASEQNPQQQSLEKPGNRKRKLNTEEDRSEELSRLNELIDQLKTNQLFSSTSCSEKKPNSDISDKPNFCPKLYVPNDTTITADEWVLITLPSTQTKIVQLKGDKTISLGKFGSFEVNKILGFNFGQAFEIQSKDDVIPVNIDDIFKEVELNDEIAGSSSDNRNIKDIGSSVQNLSTEKIEELKKTGSTSSVGLSIIKSILESHQNFDKKTKFSQEKYLKRKKEKFGRFFIVEKVTARSLLKHYIENKDLRKNLDISEESISYMLNLGDVKPNGRYLIIDESMGLLTFFMLERMQGQGEIMIVSENEHVNLSALYQYSNLPDIYLSKMVKHVNWLQFVSPLNDILSTDEAAVFYSKMVSQINVQKTELSTVNSIKNKKSQYYKKLSNYLRLLHTLHSLYSAEFDSLICISTLSIRSILPYLLKFLRGSASVVLYSDFKEVLVDAYHDIVSGSIQQRLPILAPSIHEIKARPYQAVPGKMHPVMTYRGGGGFVLFGLRVFPMESVQAVGKIGNRKKKAVE